MGLGVLVFVLLLSLSRANISWMVATNAQCETKPFATAVHVQWASAELVWNPCTSQHQLSIQFGLSQGPLFYR